MYCGKMFEILVSWGNKDFESGTTVDDMAILIVPVFLCF
jgi:hypothetical protein